MVAVLVSLSVILTASVLFPSINSRQIIDIMIACGAAAVLAAGYALSRRLRSGQLSAATADRAHARPACGVKLPAPSRSDDGTGDPRGRCADDALERRAESG